MPDGKPTGVVFRRNQLPQWRLDGGIYFVTWRLHQLGDTLSPEERSLVAAALRAGHGVDYWLSIFVVMDDHVHVLFQTNPDRDLSRILQQWKGATARAINLLRKSRGTLWQKACRTDLMRNQAAIDSRRQYIHDNPRRKWGDEPSTYLWLESFE